MSLKEWFWALWAVFMLTIELDWLVERIDKLAANIDAYALKEAHMIKEVKVVGFSDTIVYRYEDMLLVRISEVPHGARALEEFMEHQTRPYVEGQKTQDFIYLHDYDNFMHKMETGREAFWD